MIETEIWRPSPDRPGMLRYEGQRKLIEVSRELEEALHAESWLDPTTKEPVSLVDVIEGGFSHGWEPSGSRLEYFPRGRHIACFVVRGHSEGHYIHVEVLGGDPDRATVLLGKTFYGLAAGLAVVNALTRLLAD